MILIIKHVLSEGPGLIGKLFREHNMKTVIVEMEHSEKLPMTLDGIDAVISMGGPMNVYEENKYPFLKDEDIFLKKAFNAEIPVLGICLGAQLMAKALGAKVEKSSKAEIGWDKVPLTCHGIIDPLFEGVDSMLEVFQWHEDKFNLPEGAILIAENEVCAQAFKVMHNSYAFQFHIEVTPNMLEEWINRSYYKADKLKVISTFYEKKDKFVSQMNQIFRNYLGIIKLYENSPGTN